MNQFCFRLPLEFQSLAPHLVMEVETLAADCCCNCNPATGSCLAAANFASCSTAVDVDNSYVVADVELVGSFAEHSGVALLCWFLHFHFLASCFASIVEQPRPSHIDQLHWSANAAVNSTFINF